MSQIEYLYHIVNAFCHPGYQRRIDYDEKHRNPHSGKTEDRPPHIPPDVPEGDLYQRACSALFVIICHKSSL
jgi:hypothetical protein